MPKDKLKLSKKHEYLIEKLSEIPTLEDMSVKMFSKDYMYGMYADYRYNTEDVLLMVIKELTKGTQMEDIGEELCEKARVIFDYYSDKKK